MVEHLDAFEHTTDDPRMPTLPMHAPCSGQAAALAGGTTMHIDFALPVNHDLLAGFKEWKKKAQAACMEYGFHMAVTSWSPKVAADMAALVKEGINSFKFFMAYKVRMRPVGSVGRNVP